MGSIRLWVVKNLSRDAEADGFSVVVDESPVPVWRNIKVSQVIQYSHSCMPRKVWIPGDKRFCRGKKEKGGNPLQQQPKEPDLKVLIPQHLTRPLTALVRDPRRLDPARRLLAEIPHRLDVLVPLGTERDVVHPRPQPFLVPLAEQRQLVHQALALQESVEAAAERVAVHVQQVLVQPGVVLLGRLDDLEVFLLGVAVPRVALADVRELDVEEVGVLRARDFLDAPVGGVRRGAVVLEKLGGIEVVDFLDEELAVLVAPAAVAGEAACCGSPPVHFVFFLLPVMVVAFSVGHFFGPVPGGRVEDVLVRADFALGEDGEEVVDDVVRVGAVEEAEAIAERGREADVGEGGFVGYES